MFWPNLCHSCKGTSISTGIKSSWASIIVWEKISTAIQSHLKLRSTMRGHPNQWRCHKWTLKLTRRFQSMILRKWCCIRRCSLMSPKKAERSNWAWIFLISILLSPEGSVNQNNWQSRTSIHFRSTLTGPSLMFSIPPHNSGSRTHSELSPRSKKLMRILHLISRLILHHMSRTNTSSR
jgi:hypothetical protein